MRLKDASEASFEDINRDFVAWEFGGWEGGRKKGRNGCDVGVGVRPFLGMGCRISPKPNGLA